MKKNVSLDLRVHPDNPNVTIHYFLVIVCEPSAREVIGAMKFSQAWSGPWSDRKEANAWNQISTRLEYLSGQTGLEYQIVAHGTAAFVERHRKEHGWLLLS